MAKFPEIGRKSTRAWIREANQARDYTFFDLLHGYIYTRFPYFYISVGTGEHRLAKLVGPLAGRIIGWLMPGHKDHGPGHKDHGPGHKDHGLSHNSNGRTQPKGSPQAAAHGGMDFANGYHGKVVPLAAAKQLVQIKQEIRLTDLETIIPYTRARDIIMHNPEHIVALECPCRVARAKPCLPLDVCLIIGEPFAGFVMEHHPKKARWITVEEAEDILKAEDERGHVHHAFFKDAMLGRFYAICNCCDCCCGAMQAQRTGTPMLTASGYRAQVAAEKCQGCTTCTNFCQFHAITVNGDRKSHVDARKCMGCGVCANHCPHGAIQLVRDEAKGEPLEIVKLMEAARL